MRGLRYCAATIILISIILLASCNLDNHDSVAEKENITVIKKRYIKRREYFNNSRSSCYIFRKKNNL